MVHPVRISVLVNCSAVIYALGLDLQCSAWWIILAGIVLYRRTRRLAPLIISHWPMDIVAAVATLM